MHLLGQFDNIYRNSNRTIWIRDRLLLYLQSRLFLNLDQMISEINILKHKLSKPIWIVQGKMSWPTVSISVSGIGMSGMSLPSHFAVMWSVDVKQKKCTNWGNIQSSTSCFWILKSRFFLLTKILLYINLFIILY